MRASDLSSLLARCEALTASTALSLSTLTRFAAEIQLSPGLVAQLAKPDPARPYGRRVVMSTDALEVMVATWTRGAPCAPHDHGGSVGAVRVLQGRSRHQVWTLTDGALAVRHAHDAAPGDVLSCGPYLVHSMADAGAALPLMTLHLYTGSIDHMLVYDLDEEATHVVEGTCGAWVPRGQPHLIRETVPGFVDSNVLTCRTP